MIVPVEVDRDARGYWTHPALIRSCCQTTPQLMWWLRVQKLECFVMSMRDELQKHSVPDGMMARLTLQHGSWFLRPVRVGFLVQYIHGRRGRNATGSVIPQKPDASAGRRCPTPEAGKNQFPRPRRF
jgi:hypothetical protein